jgi:hypothetical protein
MALFNRSKTYELARVRETARGAEMDTQSKSDQVAYQTATLFLQAEQMARSKQSLQLEVESLKRVGARPGCKWKRAAAFPSRTSASRWIWRAPASGSAALSGDLDYAEASLAVVLGYSAADRVQPMGEERARF